MWSYDSTNVQANADYLLSLLIAKKVDFEYKLHGGAAWSLGRCEDPNIITRTSECLISLGRTHEFPTKTDQT